MPEQTKRIEALDIAKGIGIILVMIGHMTSSYLYNWIYSFHMPLFFILSGICFKNTKYTSFLAFARQRIKTLAIPHTHSLSDYTIHRKNHRIKGLRFTATTQRCTSRLSLVSYHLIFFRIILLSTCKVFRSTTYCHSFFFCPPWSILCKKQHNRFFRPYKCLFLYCFIRIGKFSFSLYPLCSRICKEKKQTHCFCFHNFVFRYPPFTCHHIQ